MVITKEELKKAVDKIPDNLLEEAYTLLKRVIPQKKVDKQGALEWETWKSSLEKFTTDFMDVREQTSQQIRESLD